MLLLHRLPFRRVELLFSMLVVTGCFALVWFFKTEFVREAANVLALITLEIILPLSVGLNTAGLLAGDPALDIVLSAYRPAWKVLVERWLAVGGIGVLLGTAGTILAWRWDLGLPKDGSAQLYIWLSPMVFYMGFASVVALLRGKMLDGVVATLALVGTSLMLQMQIPMLCAGNAEGAPCVWWLASPMLTLISAAEIYWPLNRILWLVLGVALLALSLRLTRREESLLHEVSVE